MAKRSSDLADIMAPIGAIVDKLQRRRLDLMVEVDAIDEQLERLGGITNGARGKAKASKPQRKRGGKRVRRSREEIEALAAKVVEFIGGKGKEGVSGRDIKAKFGALLPSVKQWLTEYAPDAKVKTTGSKAQTMYHV